MRGGGRVESLQGYAGNHWAALLDGDALCQENLRLTSLPLRGRVPCGPTASRRKVELEENENRKALTDYERARTFAASKRLVEDAKRADDLISSPDEEIKTEVNPKGAGRKKAGRHSKAEIAEA